MLSSGAIESFLNISNFIFNRSVLVFILTHVNGFSRDAGFCKTIYENNNINDAAPTASEVGACATESNPL